MKKISGIKAVSYYTLLFTLGVLLLISSSDNAYAGKKNAKFKIIVEIQTDFAISVQDIPVYLSENSSETSIQGVTKKSGKVKFEKLGQGIYTVSPDRDGFSFKPASQELKLSKKNTNKIFFTILKNDVLAKNSMNVPETHYPTRLCQGNDGQFYTSDSRANSVFIYNYKLDLVDRFGGLSTPLGIAVDDSGNVYVGNDGRDNVEIYNRVGKKIASIGDGKILMPNAIAIDKSGKIYVADSLDDNVKVYNAGGKLQRKIGSGILEFPSDISIKYNASGKKGKIFVADQGKGKIRIFKLNGKLIKSFGKKVSNKSSSYNGQFVRLQSIDIDNKGRIHASDSFTNNIQILNRKNGKFINSYGNYDTEGNGLNLPLDIMVYSKGKTIVANAENHSVDLISISK